MPVPISLATIPVISFLGGLYSGQASRGVVLAMVVHAAWTWFYHRGDDFPSVYDFDLLINWFFSSLLAGLVGSIMTLMFDWHPIMDGAHLRTIYERPDGSVSFRSIGTVLGRLLVVLLIIAGAHVIYELNVSGFPKWAGGLVGSVLIIIAWVAFAFLFRREAKLFQEAPEKKGYRRFTQSEIMVYVLFGALTHFIYFTAYWLSAFFWPTLAGWLNDQWYFYMSLILFGGIGIIMWIVAYFFVRNRADIMARYKPVNTGSKMRKSVNSVLLSSAQKTGSVNSQMSQRPIRVAGAMPSSTPHESDYTSPFNA